MARSPAFSSTARFFEGPPRLRGRSGLGVSRKLATESPLGVRLLEDDQSGKSDQAGIDLLPSVPGNSRALDGALAAWPTEN